MNPIRLKFSKKRLEIMSMDLTIGNANLYDIDAIYNIIEHEAQKNLLLIRSKDEIAAEIRTFKLAKIEDKPAGCASLYIWNRQLAEIRSLAVSEDFRKTGIGKKLVDALVEDAMVLGLKQVFALTYQVEFFKKLGFYRVEFDMIPDKKIWNYCTRCPLLPKCAEKAMLKDLY